jgi:hypothetical protein
MTKSDIDAVAAYEENIHYTALLTYVTHTSLLPTHDNSASHIRIKCIAECVLQMEALTAVCSIEQYGSP